MTDESQMDEAADDAAPVAAPAAPAFDHGTPPDNPPQFVTWQRHVHQSDDEHLRIPAPGTDPLDGLPPKFRAALEALLADMRAEGLDPEVFETGRTAELQGRYCARGTSRCDGVTKLSWHQLWLAVDIISASRRWTDMHFFARLRDLAKKHGLRSGGDWNGDGVYDEKFMDPPHVQWGGVTSDTPMRISPSAHAVALFASGGAPAVWAEVGAA